MSAFARTRSGSIVPGKVHKLVPFGAFVRVEDGIEGLVHISDWQPATLTWLSRSSPLVKRSSLRSSTSTWTAAASPCPSSRQTRALTPTLPVDPSIRHGCRVRRGLATAVPRGFDPED